MNLLVIDIGNTHLKWAVEQDGVFHYGGQTEATEEGISVLFQTPFLNETPEWIMVANVANPVLSEKLSVRAMEIWGSQVEILVTPKQACGVTNAYQPATKLGIDRWAAMVAAFDEVKGPVCIVDSGTAVTLDVVNREGTHLGGLIIPGYKLMQTCMQQGTRMEFRNELIISTQAELGQSTEQGIYHGTALAISGMVNKMYQKLQNELAGLSLILTGGDAEVLQVQLDYQSNIDPHLVLKGLAIIHHSRRATNII